MVLAAVGDNGYKLVLFFHILTVFATVGPALVFPLLAAMAQRDGQLALYAKWAGGLPTRVFMVASILTGVFGGALIGMSDDAHEFGDFWIWSGILLWVALLGVQHALLFPTERKFIAGDTAQQKNIQLYGSIVSLILVLLTLVMVFQPE
jgi:uncharacterized membrane protein